MKTAELVEAILKNEELHDLVTHIHDFDTACKRAVSNSTCPDDKSYWERQVSTTTKLIEVTRTQENH
ncbi:hypothetical protein VPHK389_0081 [Vibrio phage K389]|nr:hypothetical protein SIPHO010v1_p0021 [Vibrio phage 268E42.1]